MKKLRDISYKQKNIFHAGNSWIKRESQYSILTDSLFFSQFLFECGTT